MSEVCSLKNIIEAILLVADRPLTIEQLSKLFDEEMQPSRSQIGSILEELAVDWRNRGIELKEIHSGYRFQARRELSPWISRLWEERPSRYSRAFLETLALIAYRQPITRGEIEEIRGVSVSSSIMKTLQEREWVRVLGHREVPGRPALYGTTRKFLDQFNLRNLDELPSLAEVKTLGEAQIALTLVEGGLGKEGVVLEKGPSPSKKSLAESDLAPNEVLQKQ
ncbi:condensin subunit ScpB [Nitrosococcus oceani ATCC 19707]|uniref:Condensin subunit ScpB n=2 Tax=Nitrosococcus oceani TaxID=1229 RepID=Q3JC98_NITOC|nr:SMC-Scp complex subunit ScpB [Nitrosococcus oceani]ABA57548.1 condensin subunit ScpB [Nitrosococcus oceani ATCC 19707]EDZ67312.1 segregation and condensation protein B [Nitrosococcus oceani AFC27]KFI20048.1 segregation and condensation protein B [Nitrosococcus oceani C-27]GEM20663.1 SMC-Scp complex subunit ScpB [Nitrosococcus oceani]